MYNSFSSVFVSIAIPLSGSLPKEKTHLYSNGKLLSPQLTPLSLWKNPTKALPPQSEKHLPPTEKKVPPSPAAPSLMEKHLPLWKKIPNGSPDPFSCSWPAAPQQKRTSSLTARISPCHVSNSHSLLNSTICFYDHQPRGNTWLLESPPPAKNYNL